MFIQALTTGRLSQRQMKRFALRVTSVNRIQKLGQLAMPSHPEFGVNPNIGLTILPQSRNECGLFV